MKNYESDQATREEVKKIFVQFLEESGQRKTPERFAILDEIYLSREHFDAEGLYIHMKNLNYRLSRATVYNTLDLLVDCGLVRKHQFGENITRYEGAYGQKQHDHMICNVCNHVFEFCDPRIQHIKKMMGDLLHFEVTSHSLHLFGKPMTDAKGKCVTCNKKVI
ncbi:MAG: Fur family transcriptional regulator [Bacteroidia bacterium]